MATAFDRQLGAESGVQLNPLRDESELPTISDNSDQVFGIMMRATRGRIDKPFKINRGNVIKKIGKGESMRVSALNEAYVQVVEALNKGAYEAVVQRLASDSAVIKYAIATPNSGTADNVDWTANAVIPGTPYLLAVKDLECYNDGIKVEFHADTKKVGGVAQANDRIALRIRDSAGDLRYEFFGSLDPAALDDYGNSAYLPDIVASQTDAIEVSIDPSVTSIATTHSAYGYDANGREKWAKSGTLVCFVEGGTTYTTANLMSARVKLQNTIHNYAYISAGGSQSPALLAQLAQLAFDTNRQLRFDVPGNLTPEAAIAFVEQLNMGASLTAHLIHAFWTPLKSNDPTGLNGKGYFGTATLNIAYACGRNAAVNGKGFAAKNYPIAGREWPIQRNGITQVYSPSNPEMNDLAKAKINPVLYEVFTGGGRYVFKDSLTCAQVENSLKKLISVADMSSSVDDVITRFAATLKQLPVKVAVSRMADFMRVFFADCQAADWLVPSSAPEMNGAAYKYDVRPNANRPYDKVDYSYSLRYDGCARQITVTQTLTV